MDIKDEQWLTLAYSQFRYPISINTRSECCSVPRLTRFLKVSILQDRMSQSKSGPLSMDYTSP